MRARSGRNNLRKLTLSLLSLTAIASVAVAAGLDYSGKEMKPVADNEWNVSLWGIYVFTENEWRDDRYIESDHAWGGGIDAKYFFHRYFGIGIEGWVVEARREFKDISGVEVFRLRIGHESRAV